MRRDALLPGATIGILGGGQLGRMLILEARRMGYRCISLDPAADCPAAQVANDHITAALDDLAAVRELGSRSDVVTLEWENAVLETAESLESTVPLRPGSRVLAVAQHRLSEKHTARRAGLATAEFRAVRDVAELPAALEAVGAPAILKTCRGGYDGRGQVRVRSMEEAYVAYRQLSALETEVILEQWIPFEREISVITARSLDGEMVSYPVGENIHRDGILEATLVPARIPSDLAREAQRMAESLAEALEIVGLLAVEMFVDPAHQLLVNEIAPRPHNSGHYTWEACPVSQFEQHLRAVCGLPLGSTELLRPVAMLNLLGHEIGTAIGLSTVPDALRQAGVALHLYGKTEARPRRKMGHLTALADTAEGAFAAASAAKRLLMQGHGAE